MMMWALPADGTRAGDCDDRDFGTSRWSAFRNYTPSSRRERAAKQMTRGRLPNRQSRDWGLGALQTPFGGESARNWNEEEDIDPRAGEHPSDPNGKSAAARDETRQQRGNDHPEKDERGRQEREPLHSATKPIGVRADVEG